MIYGSLRRISSLIMSILCGLFDFSRDTLFKTFLEMLNIFPSCMPILLGIKMNWFYHEPLNLLVPTWDKAEFRNFTAP